MREIPVEQSKPPSKVMGTNPRVLYLANNPQNADVVRAALSRSRLSCDVQRVQTRPEFVSSMSVSKWDAILCDHPHPIFDGFTIIFEASGMQRLVPLVILSHTPTVDQAVAAMKSGAADYISFANIDSLGLALEQSLAEYDKRRIQEQERRKIEEQAALVDLTQDGVIVIDLDGHVLRWNLGAEHLFGWTAEEAAGKRIHELLKFCAGESFGEYVHVLLATGGWNGDLTKYTRQGHPRIVRSRWSLVRGPGIEQQGILMVDTDITDQRKAEVQLLRMQRLQGIGTLAGGIAHDLNNVLAPILLAVQMLREELTTETAQGVLDTVESSARRGSNIIKQVLTFARGTDGQFAAVSLDQLIGEVRRIIQETLPASIHLQVQVPDGAWTIHGDAASLQQMLMNLVDNARDAMPNGGLLRLSADNVWVDEGLARVLHEAQTGPFVVLQVSDTGVGIASENLEQIFDPFFSTKDPDKATGLGLSTALGIVKSHQGFIQVESQQNVGSKFKVFLPAVAAVESCLKTGSAPELLRGQGQTILVVDDEQSVLEVTQRTLERYGYQVMTASDGAEAVALFARDPTRVDLVVTDLMMPLMDGAATIRALRRMRPDILLVVASGLSSQARIGDVHHLGVQAVLRKPFNAEGLLTTVHKVLHHTSQPAS